MGKCVLKGLKKYQASDKSQMTYHHHCSENSQLKTWRVLKECQYELGCIDLSVWILLIHRHTEFCPLLSVFYHWFKCWKERKKKKKRRGRAGRLQQYEKEQISQANQTLNLPPASIQLSGTENAKRTSKSAKQLHAYANLLHLYMLCTL